MPTVPKLWPGSTIVCVGGGPSLCASDVQACGAAGLRVIVVNDAYRLAPWADVLYAADGKWWDWHAGVPSFKGLKFSISSMNPPARADVTVLENTGFDGLELQPTGLRTGFNGGYQAVNLAVHLGATRILLLGYDMGPYGAKTHWFGDHPDREPSPYPQMIAAFETLVDPLAAVGVDVVNCSRRSALTAFPRFTLDAALSVAA